MATATGNGSSVNGSRAGCGYLDYLQAVVSASRSTESEVSEEPLRKDAKDETQLAQAAVAFTVIQSLPTVRLPEQSDADDDSEGSFRKPKQPTRRTTAGSTKAAKHQGRKSTAKKEPRRSRSPDMFLRVDEMADDYASEAEMSGLDDYYRAEKRRVQRGSSQEVMSDSRSNRTQSRRPVNSDSECSDGTACGIRNPEVFDSDLESVIGIGDAGKAAHAKKMRRFKALAKDKFERMLLDCIVNTESIKDDYGDMAVDRKTIKKLEHVTRLSLLHPKAFSKGVLAGNKVTGAVLHGPPGTGKSLLAKGLARNSGFNMILASTAELWQKCHGEDEKVIKALFSMGRKMHPAIVFIDEADGLLGNRKAGEKRHIRAMLNQFLMEWDGLNSGKNAPFILLATNRPFDLDPAVLRRAPVRIHLDIPTTAQRNKILELLLKDETLGPDITLTWLAKLTPKYTGSDLKNLCVTAATECVSEQQEDSHERILRKQHFQSAMVSIKATGLSKTVEHEFKNFERGAKQEARRQDEE